MQTIRKFGFLFVFIYTVLFSNSVQFFFSQFIHKIWSRLVPPFARLISGNAEVAPVRSGSGDTLHDYYLVLLMLLVSLMISLIVILIDRKRPNYRALSKWLLLLLRYYIASQMITYGLAKVFAIQFAAPSLFNLEQALGDKSPMGLLWTFMGHSKAYVIFTGIAELLGGLFLLSRKTTLLGALITFGVMSNVMMMNYCYDVPVKLLSTHLVVFSLFILSYYAKSIVNFLLLNRDVHATEIPDIVPLHLQKYKAYLKWAVLLSYICYSAYSYNSYSTQLKSTEPSVLTGIYEVRQFQLFRDGQLLDHPAPQIVWDKLIVSKRGSAKITLKESSPYYRSTSIDTVNQTVRFMQSNSTASDFKYDLTQGGTLQLNGYFKQDSLSMILQQNDDYNLLNHKFRWVQEYPDNQ